MKYIIYTVLAIILLYFSIDVKSLDQVKKPASVFDAKGAAIQFVNTDYPKIFNQAIALAEVDKNIASDKMKFFSQFGKSAAIGNQKYFLIKGEGIVKKINEDNLVLNSNNKEYTLATEFIYGASIRDAGGLFDIKKFPIAADVQALTGEINAHIRNQIVKPFLQTVKLNDKINYVGAIELNEEHPDLKAVEIKPIKLQIVK